MSSSLVVGALFRSGAVALSTCTVSSICTFSLGIIKPNGGLTHSHGLQNLRSSSLGMKRKRATT